MHCVIIAWIMPLSSMLKCTVTAFPLVVLAFVTTSVFFCFAVRIVPSVLTHTSSDASGYAVPLDRCTRYNVRSNTCVVGNGVLRGISVMNSSWFDVSLHFTHP